MKTARQPFLQREVPEPVQQIESEYDRLLREVYNIDENCRYFAQLLPANQLHFLQQAAQQPVQQIENERDQFLQENLAFYERDKYLAQFARVSQQMPLQEFQFQANHVNVESDNQGDLHWPIIQSWQEVIVNVVPETTKLMDDAKHGRTNNCCQLLAHGADVNEQDENGMTPMMYAASKGAFALAWT